MGERLTWAGPFEGSGAYPTMNRQLCRALARLGHAPLRNEHNDGAELTPVQIRNTYPLGSPTIRHPINVGLAIWEFTGQQGVPLSFRRAFEEYDLICAPGKWVCDQFKAVTDTPVVQVPLGVDPSEFYPDGPAMRWEEWLGCEAVLLWVGGTDRRHGFDVALEVMRRLPDRYHLVAKQSVHYPEAEVEDPRVHVIREDLPTLAPLYRAAHLLLHTARGVGDSLPVREALACGCPVVSSDLPPVREYAPEGQVRFGRGEWQPMGIHHVHRDCLPVWFEPDPAHLAQLVLAGGFAPWAPRAWAHEHAWDVAAGRLLQALREHLGLTLA